MKFKLINQPCGDRSVDEQVFFNRGMQSNERVAYMAASEKSLLHPTLLDHMDEGLALLTGHIKKMSKIFFQVDSDADGYTSTAFLLNYLDAVYGLDNLNITWRVHNGKEHGVILDTVIQDNVALYDLVVLIDAGSNQFEEHAKLHSLGTDVLVIDHHDCETYSEHAVVINNQMSENYPNKAMCGVGVAYKFCKRFDELLEIDLADTMLDLVAVGSIADMMDMRSVETHYLTKTGIENINNPLIKSLVQKQEYSLRGAVTRIGIAFYIAPLINATIRVGTNEEKELMFKAMLNKYADDLVPSTKRGCKGQVETIIEQATRNCGNIHARQKRSRDAGAASVKSYIKENGIEDDKIMLVIGDNSLDKNLVGLIANQIMAEYKKPVLLLRECEHDGVAVLQGSGRGYDRSELTDFKEFLHDSNFFNFVEGHANAFGASLPIDKKSEFIDYANKELANFTFDSQYEVDYLFEGMEIDNSVIFDIANLKSYWGKGLEEPYVAIQGLTLTPKRVQLLSPTSKPTIKITLNNGLTIMKFFSSFEEYQSLTRHPEGAITLNIVAKCSINEWNGKVSPQLIISEYEIIDECSMIF